MFKFLLAIVFILNVIPAFSLEDMEIDYAIKSDTIDDTVPQDSCRITGKVLGPGGTALIHALVATSDFVSQTTTDSLGNFELIISEKDSSIFAYKLDYTEVVIYGYDFKGQHAVSIDFYLAPSILREVNLKPVVYCYGNVKNAAISYDFKTNLTFNYPAYNNGWNFSTDPAGNIKVNDKTYPYLFWEGENEKADYSQCGEGSYLVKTDTIVDHLESALTEMKLKPREKTDFITFWGPKLVQKEYAIIKFLNDDEYAKHIAAITVSPQPDNMLRFYMLFTPLDYPVPSYNVNPPTFNSIERNGFTVLEWGGSQIPLQNTWLQHLN